MYPETLYANERKFCVYPAVVKADEESTISIYSINSDFEFCDDDVYEVHIVPKDNNGVTSNPDFAQFDYEEICPVYMMKSEGGVLKIKYCFKGQQEWIIHIAKKDDCGADWYWTDSFPKTRTRVSVYSLSSNLYGTIPLKSDFHIHTTLSDGHETPEFNVAQYRKEGFDAVSITDHKVFNDGKKLGEYFDCTKGFYIVPGEEVHDNGGKIHMVSLGGSFCISDVLKNNQEYVKGELERLEKEKPIPDNVNRDEYLLREFIYNEIKKSGGLAIHAHPLWQLPQRFNTELDMSMAIFENRMCDAFEILGGCTQESNNLCVNLYNMLCARGIKYPVVASSDSHYIKDGVTAFNEQYTICFAKEGDIIGAIYNGMSIAAEAYKGEFVRFYGDFELVKYAHFLRRNYFPRHNELCSVSGELMIKYVNGDESVKDEIIKAEEKILQFKKEFFAL